MNRQPRPYGSLQALCYYRLFSYKLWKYGNKYAITSKMLIAPILRENGFAIISTNYFVICNFNASKGRNFYKIK